MKHVEIITKRYATIQELDKQIIQIEKMAARIADGKYEEIGINFGVAFPRENNRKVMIDGVEVEEGTPFFHPAYGMVMVHPHTIGHGIPNNKEIDSIHIPIQYKMGLSMLQILLNDLKERRDNLIKSIEHHMKKGLNP